MISGLLEFLGKRMNAILSVCSGNVVVLNLIDLKGRSRLGSTLVFAEAIAASTVRQANHGSLVSQPAISLAKMLLGLLRENV